MFVKPLGGEKKELFRVIVISFILFHLTLTAYYYKAPYIILPIILSYKNNERYNNISIVSSGGEVRKKINTYNIFIPRETEILQQQ